MEQIIRAVAERKIQEAIEEGVFDNLPGKGKPLQLDDDPFTPPHLRLANRILKNAGVLPDWMQLEKDIEAARSECSRMLAEMERSYPERLAALVSPESKQKFASWHARDRSEYLRAIKQVNLEIAKLSLMAPSIERPFVPYRTRELTQAFDERFPASPSAREVGFSDNNHGVQPVDSPPARESKIRSDASEAYRARRR